MEQQGQDGAGVPVHRTGLSNAEKDRLRADFGRRLRELLDLAGLSSRAFAQRYPAYRDSTIRKYTLGKNLPPWDFLRDLLAEVGRSVTDAASEQRASELYNAYRTTLVRFGADVRGSDQNSLLLRLYDGEQILAELNQEIELLREGERRLLAQLEQARAGGDSRRARELELQGEELVGRREALVSRNADLVGDLERCRALIRMREESEMSLPAHDPDFDRASGSRTSAVPRPWLLVGAVASVVLLVVTAFAVGAWSRKDRDDTASPQGETSPTRTSPSSTPAPSSPTPTSSSPATTPTASGAVPAGEEIPEPDHHKIDLSNGYAIDISYVKPKIIEGAGDFYYETDVFNDPRVDTSSKRRMVLLDEREKGSLDKCLTDTRFSTSGIGTSRLNVGSQICTTTDRGHVALVTIRTMPQDDAASDYLGLDVTVWRYAAAPDIEEE
ncbi:hypothetical protein OG333_38535 (plasmid) [Streptomyces anulatus]|uniref:hypothetical protein n=1 Tax=Streptomyces anulatus TaxID=1892 RepID=UPI0037929071|nr:hypothetical protein OG333_38535 [Streptomyces anulatus]